MKPPSPSEGLTAGPMQGWEVGVFYDPEKTLKGGNNKQSKEQAMEVPVPRAGRGGVTASSSVSSHCSRPASGNSPGRRAARAGGGLRGRAGGRQRRLGCSVLREPLRSGCSSQVAPPGLPSLQSLNVGTKFVNQKIVHEAADKKIVYLGF